MLNSQRDSHQAGLTPVNCLLICRKTQSSIKKDLRDNQSVDESAETACTPAKDLFGANDSNLGRMYTSKTKFTEKFSPFTCSSDDSNMLDHELEHDKFFSKFTLCEGS